MTRRLGILTLLGILVIVAALVIAPAAIASGKHLKLTAVVTGQKREVVAGWGDQQVTLYAVKQGSKKVGTLAVSSLGGCVGNMCPEAGTANLKVGRVKGKATLKTVTTLTGCAPCSPPIPTKFKSNTGMIFTAQDLEKIRVNGDWPITKGSKVTFVLSY